MEFLRFGSSIPGSYWGCCACCIIQNFKVDPDAKASIQLVDGDCGYALTDGNNKEKFVGTTWRDIFWHRLRFGTFSDQNMPNHAFFAILTQSQISSGYGKKWLSILKEAGFEFIRSVDNSVYSGPKTIKKVGEGSTSAHPNYIFGLFRNIGQGAMKDPFTAPKAWTDLESVVPEAWEDVVKLGDIEELVKNQQEAQLKLWKNLPKKKWYTREELNKAGVPVWLAGQRSNKPQQQEQYRKEESTSGEKVKKETKAAPFAKTAEVFEAS